MRALDQIALAAVEQPAVVPTATGFSNVKTDAPTRHHRITEDEPVRQFKAFKRDYLEREASNQSLGLAGEEFVVQFEHCRLIELEQQRLAEASKSALEQSGKWSKPIVTEIVPAETFYKAEEYHQRYFEKQGIEPTCHL